MYECKNIVSLQITLFMPNIQLLHLLQPSVNILRSSSIHNTEYIVINYPEYLFNIFFNSRYYFMEYQYA